MITSLQTKTSGKYSPLIKLRLKKIFHKFKRKTHVVLRMTARSRNSENSSTYSISQTIHYDKVFILLMYNQPKYYQITKGAQIVPWTITDRFLLMNWLGSSWISDVSPTLHIPWKIQDSIWQTIWLPEKAKHRRCSGGVDRSWDLIQQMLIAAAFSLIWRKRSILYITRSFWTSCKR